MQEKGRQLAREKSEQLVIKINQKIRSRGDIKGTQNAYRRGVGKIFPLEKSIIKRNRELKKKKDREEKKEEPEIQRIQRRRNNSEQGELYQ